MSEARDKRLDLIVARALRWGAYVGFIVLLAGVIGGFFLPRQQVQTIETVGVVLMMATPVFRVFIALLVFLSEKDYKYSLITLGVLLILVLGSVFGIGEH
jgi:uncharacterized membrane protein